MTIAADQLAERIRSLPGMEPVLAAMQGLPPAFLVGGAVRDLLRGSTGIDLDLAIEGDAPAAARTLAERLGGEATEHPRFGTATVRAGTLSLDVATTRRESYPGAGALPVVERAPLREDLARRDFTINAMAAALAGDEPGRLIDPHGGLGDLEAGIVRVLHDRSFVEDPTRLLRALRYEARLGFSLDRRTEELARAAAAACGLRSVSGPRVRDELLDLLSEAGSASAAGRLRELDLDRCMASGLTADAEAVASASLAAGETGADRTLAALAALVASAPAELADWLDGLGLERGARDRVMRAAGAAPALVGDLRADLRPSELHRLLAPEPEETLALALALGAPGEPILRYLRDLRHVRLEITGEDLVAAGVHPSPAIGLALRETLERKLDGALAGREQELRSALEVART